MVSKTLPVALLQLSRRVSVKAKLYLASKLATLQKFERFHFVLDIDCTRLFYSFGGSKPGMVRMVLPEHEARDVAHPLRTLSETYPMHEKSIAQGTQAYVDMRSFVQRCSTALLNKFPETTTVAICFEPDESIPFRRHLLDLLTIFLGKSPWDKLLPRPLRLCELRELVEEGGESDLLLKLDECEE
jgi:hypothetical protein